MQSFDFIISGAGCAGLSLAMRLIDSGKFINHQILLVDVNFKKTNDRTWCFWERHEGFFDQIVYRRWEKLWFYSHRYSTLKDIRPYEYKMIRGADFYKYCLENIRRHSNFHLLEAPVESIHSDLSETYIRVGGVKITARYIFNSIFFRPPAIKKNEYFLLQHFKGWVIETPGNLFNPNEAILMDFRVPQDKGTAFVYTMPFSETKALIEYTFFTQTILPDAEYDQLLNEYLKKIPGMETYTITETEFGTIPMTSQRFDESAYNVFHIGTAGGRTRASTGYTFQNIQTQTREIVQKLITKQRPIAKNIPARFRYYDRLLLDIITTRGKDAANIFSHLFCMNSAKSIFDFLDAQSSITQDFLVISSLPKKPFLRSALRLMFHARHD